MAENEVLDVSWGRRWKATRLLLRKPEVTPADLASCACEDAKHDVISVLKRSLQKGSSLLAILKAAGKSPTELRAAVGIFPDQQLARIARDACASASTLSPADVADAAASLMFDRFADRTVLFARRNGDWQSADRRANLRTELEQRRGSWVSSIAEVLEKSLRGEKVKGTRRHRSGERITAQALVGRSLRPQLPSNGRDH